MRLEEVSLADLMTDPGLRSEWRSLAATVDNASYFQTPDWVVSWWETLAARPPGIAALIRQDEHLVGVFPLATVREDVTGRLPLRVSVTSNAGTGIGTDHAGWLAIEAADESLAAWTVGRGGLLLRGLSLELGARLGGRLIEQVACPRLLLAAFPGTMSTKLAKTLRNARRRLDDEGVSFIWKMPGQVDQSDLDALYRLHEVRRTEAGDKPVFDDPVRRAFHNRLLTEGDDLGGSAVMMAKQGDEVVGVLYGFVWRNTFAYYQVGWDPSFHRLSLGSVLVIESIETCVRSELSVFDFLRGAESYKYRFGASDVDEGTFVVGRSFGTGLIAAVAGARRRLRRDGV